MILAQVGSFWLPVEASTFSTNVDSLFYFIYWLSLVCFVPMMAVMTYFVVKYRRRSNTEVPRNVPGHHLAMELTWTIIPSLIVVVIFVWGFADFMRERTVPEGAYMIRVKAQKWAWTFEYPGGLASNELHVPKGVPVHLLMTSSDVLHSLYIPAFRAKMDVVPGRYNELWFNATITTLDSATGKDVPFPLYCAEYCGASTNEDGSFAGGHSSMRAMVYVHEQAEYDKWLADAIEVAERAPPLERGKKQFEIRGCFTCHSTDGTAKVGPSFKDLWGKEEQTEDGRTVKVDENYVRESILDPAASIVKGYAGKNMPSFKGVMKDQDIEGIFAYLESLNPNAPKHWSIMPAPERKPKDGAAPETTTPPQSEASGQAVPPEAKQ